MTFRLAVPVACLFLVACAQVIDEQRTSAVIERGFHAGERYDIVTQTVQGSNGTFQRTRVVYWGRSATCVLDGSRDCELAAIRLIDQDLGRGRF
jgi:hypothetical protein